AASCSCRSLAHPTILWHHLMGHLSISHLCAMSSQHLVLGLLRVLPSLPPSLAPPCGPCVEGRLRATPHSSSLRLATEPFETLHLDVWGPASRPGPERESLFLVVVDDYSCYTTVFPLAKKSDVTSTLIRWLLTTADTRGRRVSCLHSDRGGLVMEIARTSMTHAHAPHFLWPYAVRYAAHQLNLWPHRPVFGPGPLISPRAVSCVFLGFTEDLSDYTFYHPPLHGFFDSRDVRFDESVPYYARYPYRGFPVPPAPLFLTSAPPRAPSVQPPPLGLAPSADPAGAGFFVARTLEVLALEVLKLEQRAYLCDNGGRGPGSGGAGVGAEPVTVGDSSLRGAGVSGAIPGGATTGGAPSAGPGEPGTDRVTSGGAGPRGGSLESGHGATTAPDTTPPPHPYPTRHQARVCHAREEQLQLEREERELERQQLELQVSGLRTLGLPSPSPPSPPSPPVSGPPLPSPDASPAVFPPPLPPLFPPLSHTWPLCCSPRARPSSLVPFTDLLTYRPVLSRVLASLVTDPCAFLSSVSALTAGVTEFASTHCLDYTTSLVAAPPTNPLAARDESALGCDPLKDRQFELEFLAATSPHLCAMLLAPEGDPDALDISTPRTYAEAVSGPWASQWRAAMDSEMASYRSTCTYVDEVPPLGANVVDGMWIFRVKRPPGSPPVFKACYVARGFSLREGVEFFQTFTPTPKMTTLRVLVHVAAHRDYELHSLDFSTAFLQSSLHEEVWLRRPSAFTSTFPPGTQWRLRRPVYGLRQAPREWHDTLRPTLSDLGFQPSSADPSLFVRRGSTPFLVLVYVNDLVFATGDKVALADVKLKLQKRHTCTDLGELRHYLHMFICSSSVSTSTAEAEIYAGAMAAQELRWLTFLLNDLSERPSSAPTLFTDNKATILHCREPRLESRVKHINIRYLSSARVAEAWTGSFRLC
ncbi:unnamed protein product, partial [Closterium sp. NIES-53]